jgi:hypothetical protein
VIGFLLGPGGLSIFVLVSMASKKRAIRSGEIRECPFCSESVTTEAKLCGYCKKELPAINELPNQTKQVEPLHDAVWNGDWATARQLLINGSDVNKINENGDTALELARKRGDKLIIDLLVSHSAIDRITK